MPSILVINPNSSKKVTDNLRGILKAPPNITLEFYTAPLSSPEEIDGTETLVLSEKAALPDLLSKRLHLSHDGFLICCYSDHPLILSLARETPKPVLGIMQATLLYSYANARLTKLFILTSTSGWNHLLDEAIISFSGSCEFPCKKFERTRALDVSVLSLADASEFKKITDRVKAILEEYENAKIDCVLLGCAGMAGLDEKLRAIYPHIEFIDSCKAGVAFLVSLMAMAV